MKIPQMNSHPQYIFETSWEVCNKVGGIYTVLATKAPLLKSKLQDQLIFIGPDVWTNTQNPWFEEDPFLFKGWRETLLEKENIRVKVGRWLIPEKPVAILVDFQPFFQQKDYIYSKMWDLYKIDSLHGYGDYDESCMFACAAAAVMESFYNHQIKPTHPSAKVVAHFNEWQTGMGLLWLKYRQPEISTLFTTHATSIGRSIAGNNKPLYDYFDHYNGDQMARELNMVSKHSVEKAAAHHADCFTTVSEITGKECSQLLEKTPDIITPNGFENDFVPQEKQYEATRKLARERLQLVSESLLGYSLSKDTVYICTSGRYEYKNKGIDAFIESLRIMFHSKEVKSDIVAFIMVPAWVDAPREDLSARLTGKLPNQYPLFFPFLTHWLHNMEHDRAVEQIKASGFHNDKHNPVKIIFVPSYLNGNDGIFNMDYYHLLCGMDATIFPSYYEPWGYTPLESIAFGIPTITTSLAGFGLWAQSVMKETGLKQGVEVIERTDSNFNEVTHKIAQNLIDLSKASERKRAGYHKKAQTLAQKALWEHFIHYYEKAYSIAFHHQENRINQQHI